MHALSFHRCYLVVGLVALALIGSACGGINAKSKGPSHEAVLAFQDGIGPWLDQFTAEKFADIDRDYVYCLGPDDPVPLATAVPDPSGHSRARIPCADVAARIKAERLDRYRELVQELRDMPVPDEKPLQDAHQQLAEIYGQRLTLYEDIVKALDAGDDAKLAELRQTLVDVVKAEEAGPPLIESVLSSG